MIPAASQATALPENVASSALTKKSGVMTDYEKKIIKSLVNSAYLLRSAFVVFTRVRSLSLTNLLITWKVFGLADVYTHAVYLRTFIRIKNMLTLDSEFKIPGHVNKPGQLYFGLTHLFLNGKYQKFPDAGNTKSCSLKRTLCVRSCRG